MKNLHPEVRRLVDQLQYAYQHGGGHSVHVNNAMHTAYKLTEYIESISRNEIERCAQVTESFDICDPKYIAEAIRAFNK